LVVVAADKAQLRRAGDFPRMLTRLENLCEH